MICNNHWNACGHHHGCTCNGNCHQCNTCGCNTMNPCRHHDDCWHYPPWYWECARPWDRWNRPNWPQPQPGRPGPIGPVGPVGPMGPAAPTVYGGIVNTTPQILSLTEGVPTVAPLTVQLPYDDVTYASANAITVNEAGDYAISYFLTNAEVVGTATANITLTVRSNGVNIPNTAIGAFVAAEDYANINGETIVTLPAGAVVDLTIRSTETIGLTLGDNTTIALILRKLG